MIVARQRRNQRSAKVFFTTQRNEEREARQFVFALQTIKVCEFCAHLFNAQPKAPAWFGDSASRRLRLGVKRLWLRPQDAVQSQALSENL
jgi:hypothetical protein